MKNIAKAGLVAGFLTVLAASPAGADESRTASGNQNAGIKSSYTVTVPTGRYAPKSWGKHDHPQQWQGQDWDPAAWGKDWTPETTLDRMYAAGILYHQYFSFRTPVIEVGPRFYKLSDLDQRRTLKLVNDYYSVAENGYSFFEIRDWNTHQRIGIFSKIAGMQLD